MYIRLTILSTILMALFMLLWQPGYAADQHKKEDVSALITEVQSRLSTIKSGSSSELVRSETSRIDESCALSQRLLTEGKIDEAYNEINLANLYFQMIDARIDLQKAIIELDDTKKNLSR
jgi:hypothetical protein